MRTRSASSSSSAVDEPAVADAAEVLRRIEAERRRDAGRRDAVGAERLRSVLDQRQTERGQLLEREPGRPKRCTGMIARVSRVNRRSTSAGIEVERRLVDVGEDGCGADASDCLSRRVEREGRADDLVPGADLERTQHEHDRIGAVGDADRMRHAEVGGGLLLEAHERSDRG